MSENTPLIPGRASEVTQIDDVYNRFSKTRKRVIVAVISLAGITAPFASACFVPCVPQVAKDLNTTGTIVNYTVGIYMFVMGMGTLVWAPYSRFYGRQPIYLISLPLLCIGSLSVSSCRNTIQLVMGRSVQAFGASSIMSVGAATISDIYRLEERGTAMGIYFGAYLLGPALAPLAGGLAVVYSSWRTIQVILFGMSLTVFVCVVIVLPETSHPGSRGIDRALNQEPTARHGPKMAIQRWEWVWLNPFKALSILRGPNILFIVVASALILISDFALLIPLSYTMGPRYGIINPALIGACFLFSGLGNVLGTPLTGRLSDQAIIKGRKRRGGQWVPEDRLLVTLPGALIFVPISSLLFGMTTQFVKGRFGLVINLTCLFMNGIGVALVLAPAGTYSVDILYTQSAEVVAVNIAIRNALCSLAIAAVLPMINAIGVGATYGIAAGLAWIAFGLLWITIRYGQSLRSWADIGYTTSMRDS